MLAVLVGGLAIQVNSSSGVGMIVRRCTTCEEDRDMSCLAPGSVTCGVEWTCPAGCVHETCSTTLYHWPVMCTTCEVWDWVCSPCPHEATGHRHGICPSPANQ
ncbi:putative signal peptide protein [Puccinia sorghi]|uniref:Putative signal peptide protein n=1 Tax=Puccinia sorghi TaxID=27349 RepID=A0A0L6UE39_9BASI|nr:putative signal peptide protein [Puccinia sorghi]